MLKKIAAVFFAIFAGALVGIAVAQTPWVAPAGPPSFPPPSPVTILCNVQSPAPTASAGTMFPVQCDSAGNLKSASGTVFDLNVTPTVTAATYAANNDVGGLITINVTSGGSGTVQRVTVFDKSSNNLQLDAVFFDTNPTASTITDKTNVTIAAADAAKIIGVAHLGDFTNFTTGGSVAQAQTIGLNYKLSGLLYMALIARGAVTYASTSDVIVGVGGTN